jgi:ribonuclease BN (tRNA processing enzyme)
VLAYTGDTGPTEALLELAGGADLLLAEASFRDGDDNPDSLHLTGLQAGEVAAKAGAKRLVLTHVPPWHEGDSMLAEARAAYAGPVELATAGAVYPLPG